MEDLAVVSVAWRIKELPMRFYLVGVCPQALEPKTFFVDMILLSLSFLYDSSLSEVQACNRKDLWVELAASCFLFGSVPIQMAQGKNFKRAFWKKELIIMRILKQIVRMGVWKQWWIMNSWCLSLKKERVAKHFYFPLLLLFLTSFPCLRVYLRWIIFDIISVLLKTSKISFYWLLRQNVLPWQPMPNSHLLLLPLLFCASRISTKSIYMRESQLTRGGIIVCLSLLLFK